MFSISKLCADHLRAYVSSIGLKLKATHARELVAAFFGYKSHAAQLADYQYPLSAIGDAVLLVPDTGLMDVRRRQLTGLPPGLPVSAVLAQEIADFLEQRGHFDGYVCLAEPVETYVMETVIPAADAQIYDDLSGIMAETNAYFDETCPEEAEVKKGEDALTVLVTGQVNGTSDHDRPFCGDQIDMSVSVEYPRIAGHVGYGEPHIEAAGAVNDDWVDPALKYGSSG